MGRAARAAIVAASAAALVQVGAACGKEYGSTPDVDAAVDAPPPNPPPADDAAPDASCPVRFLPDEGTYTYSDIFSADKLTIGDSAAPTQAFDSPFFATVTHDAPGCFELTAYLSKGPDGRHVHAWHFCNACDRDAGSLDLVDETDDFTIAMLGATQHSTYTCTRPNPYLVTDVPEGGVIAQAACTGTSTGTQSRNIQIVPTSYVYEGITTVAYAAEDASVQAYQFQRKNQAIVSGGNPSAVDTSHFLFDVDSGIIMSLVVVTNTSSNFGAEKVSYQFSVAATRTTSSVSPVLVDP